MRTWFTITAKADGTGEVTIFDEIGAWGVTAKMFIDSLKPFKGKDVTVSINSPGGSVFDALAMYNALRSNGASVTVRVMGVAASAASLIAMAGDKIIMPENSFMMIHNPWTVAAGNADDMREMADVLDKIGSSLVATYVARSGKSEEEVKALLAAETWMTAQEAVEMGFADEVEDVLAVSASFDLDRLPENVRAIFASAAPAAAAEEPAAEEPAAEEVKPESVEADEVPAATFADQVQSIADRANLGQFGALWALDASIKTVEDVTAAVTAAREISALCAVAKLPEKANEFIRARKSIDDVRAALCNALAAEDERQHTDTAPKAKSSPSNTAQPGAFKTADVWAARRKSH